jgi:hypothetical protein
MLFDLADNPDQFHDSGRSDAQAAEIERLHGYIAEWWLRMAQRVTVSDDDIRTR